MLFYRSRASYPPKLPQLERCHSWQKGVVRSGQLRKRGEIGATFDGSPTAATSIDVLGITAGSARIPSNASWSILAIFCQREDWFLLMPNSSNVDSSVVTDGDCGKSLPRLSCPLAFSISASSCPHRRSARNRISIALRSASVFRAHP